MSDDVVHQALQTRPARPVGDPGGNTRDVRDRLETKIDEVFAHDNRECNMCKRVGHIARNCTSPAAQPTKPPANRPDAMVAHKTTGHICEFFEVKAYVICMGQSEIDERTSEV